MLKDMERRCAYLSAPAKALTEAYQKGTRFFDQLKEIILIDHGLVHTSDLFHGTAHWFPGQFDVIGDILHQRHVMQEYGETPEFPGVGDDMEAVFNMAVSVLEGIELRLRAMIKACDDGGDPALARQFENLQIGLSQQTTKYLTAWKMYEESDSATSYDNWIANMKGGDN